MSPTAPRVTVLVPAYNAEPFLPEALACLAVQTYRNFEVLVIDDGSSDRTAAIAQAWADHDSRFRLVRNERNLGLIATLNRGLDMARHEFIARMDADDLCPANRLELQVAYLDGHPDIDLVGGNGTLFGLTQGAQRFPLSPEAVRRRLYFDNALSHNVVTFRRTRFNEPHLAYDPRAIYAEDYDLWVRLAESGGRLANLPDALYEYRIHGASVTQSRRAEQEATAGAIRRRQWARMGVRLDEAEIAFADRYQFGGSPLPTRETLHTMRKLAAKLRHLPIAATSFEHAFERGRFLVSCLPRPRGAADRAKLTLALLLADPHAALAFVAGHLTGRP